jgi:hypothetical protein
MLRSSYVVEVIQLTWATAQGLRSPQGVRDTCTNLDRPFCDGDALLQFIAHVTGLIGCNYHGGQLH